MNAKITAVILAAALGGCGFHLKGSLPQDTLPATQWRVSGAQLDADLQTALLRAKGSLHRDADAEIRVLDVAEKRDIYTITRGAKLNEYLYSLRVSAQAYRRGKAWGAPIQVEVRRSMSYRDETILGKEHEEALLWQEMRQDAAAQIVRRLAFLPKE
ncbi:LPS assembly lipoprotein LptE [Kingella denitrificans]|uniref:LPS-assembly lipoprotein LptE n=1 Tax=Kingella denitrificans TaxID=502 RepID=UPI0028D77260|nr:LPS assembly lipoprotein LptE [Kingella denitrificans]